MKKIQRERNNFIEFLKNKAKLEFVEKVEIEEEEDLGMIGLIKEESRVDLFEALKEKINDENLVNFDVEESLVLGNKRKINEVRYDFFHDYSKDKIKTEAKFFRNTFFSKYLATSLVAASVVLLFFSMFLSGLESNAGADNIGKQKTGNNIAASRTEMEEFILKNSRSASKQGVVAGAEEAREPLVLANSDEEKSTLMTKLSSLAAKQITLSELMESKLLSLFKKD